MKEQLARYAELEAQRRSLKAQLETVDHEMGRLEPQLLEHFAELGLERVSVNGTTIYLHGQTWAGVDYRDGEDTDVGYERACEALRQAGLQDLVKTRFNVQQVSAYVRELQRDGVPLPPQFDGAIRVTEKFALRTRKSG